MTHDRITSSFDAASTAAEVVDGIDLHGKRMIVTGGSSGIGNETARVLAGAGADVLSAVRDPEAGRSVADDINTGLDSPGSRSLSSTSPTFPRYDASPPSGAGRPCTP